MLLMPAFAHGPVLSSVTNDVVNLAPCRLGRKGEIRTKTTGC
jgi:hypothetical protein